MTFAVAGVGVEEGAPVEDGHFAVDQAESRFCELDAFIRRCA